MDKCDEIIIVMDIVSRKKTNTIATNVTSNASVNCDSKKVGDCYILYSFISNLLTITIICCRHAKRKCINPNKTGLFEGSFSGGG